MGFNLDNMADVLRARGLKVVEVDGWKTRGYAQQDLKAAKGVLWHHTATASARNPAAGNMPTLNVLINGHSTLPGPLANIGLGRDGTCYIVATGVANHAGTGVAAGIPRNEGNHYLIGIEAESSGTFPWDWTQEQLDAMPKLGAALELAYLMGEPEDYRLQLGHLEYSDAGKTDPAGLPGGMSWLRAAINNQIAAWSAKPPAPSKPNPAPAPAPGRKTYPLTEPHWTVKKGDTLSSISRFYYGDADADNLNKLAAYNGIKVSDVIKVGEKIWAPGPFGWIIEQPDTIRSIAAKYGYDPDYIARINGLPNADAEIYVGNTLWIKK